MAVVSAHWFLRSTRTHKSTGERVLFASALLAAALTWATLQLAAATPRASPALARSLPAPTPLRTLDADPTGTWAIAFSPDGALLVAAGLDGSLRRWDTTTGIAGGILHRGRVRSADVFPQVVALSRSAGLVALGDADGGVVVWDMATGRQLPGPPRADQPVSALAVAPKSGPIAVAHADGAAELWDARRGQAVWRVAREGTATSMVFSPNGRTLAMGLADGGVVLFDAPTGRLVGTLDAAQPALALAFAPDGRNLATAEAESVTLWDTATGEALFVLPVARVRSISVSPSGTALLVGTIDGEVGWLDARTGTLLDAVQVPGPLARIVVDARRGTAATVSIVPDSVDPTTHLATEVRLWDADPTGRRRHGQAAPPASPDAARPAHAGRAAND